MREKWEDNTPFIQSYLIAYEQTRQHVEDEDKLNMMKVMAGQRLK